MEKLKRLYCHFAIVFFVLFLGSSVFVDPRSWWSFYNVTFLDNNSFITKMSGQKIAFYALIALVLVAILNQPSVKKAIKTVLNVGVKKLQSSLNVIKNSLN